MKLPDKQVETSFGGGGAVPPLQSGGLATILVIDGDCRSRETLGQVLGVGGFEVDTAGDRQEAQRHLLRRSYHLVILDPDLPGETRFGALRWLVGKMAAHVVVLSAAEGDAGRGRVMSLELGAEDYLVKPFSPAEMIARIRAVLRRLDERNRPPPSPALRIYRFHGFTLDPVHRRVTDPQGSTLDLTRADFELLRVMLERCGEVLSRDVLYELVHRRRLGMKSRAIDAAIFRLRGKFANWIGIPELIRTARGDGYVFVSSVEAEPIRYQPQRARHASAQFR